VVKGGKEQKKNRAPNLEPDNSGKGRLGGKNGGETRRVWNGWVKNDVGGYLQGDRLIKTEKTTIWMPQTTPTKKKKKQQKPKKNQQKTRSSRVMVDSRI